MDTAHQELMVNASYYTYAYIPILPIHTIYLAALRFFVFDTFNLIPTADSKSSLSEVAMPLTPSLSHHSGASASAGRQARSPAQAHEPALPFLHNPALFNIKSEPSHAAPYDHYSSHAPHYHSQQHYLHALQVSEKMKQDRVYWRTSLPKLGLWWPAEKKIYQDTPK